MTDQRIKQLNNELSVVTNELLSLLTYIDTCDTELTLEQVITNYVNDDEMYPNNLTQHVLMSIFTFTQLTDIHL